MSNNRYILQFRRNNGYAESRDKAVELIKSELPKCKEGEAVLCKWKDSEKDGVLMGVSNGDGSYKYMDVDETTSTAIPLKMAEESIYYNLLGTPSSSETTGGGGELSEAYTSKDVIYGYTKEQDVPFMYFTASSNVNNDADNSFISISPISLQNTQNGNIKIYSNSSIETYYECGNTYSCSATFDVQVGRISINDVPNEVFNDNGQYGPLYGWFLRGDDHNPTIYAAFDSQYNVSSLGIKDNYNIAYINNYGFFASNNYASYSEIKNNGSINLISHMYNEPMGLTIGEFYGNDFGDGKYYHMGIKDYGGGNSNEVYTTNGGRMSFINHGQTNNGYYFAIPLFLSPDNNPSMAPDSLTDYYFSDLYYSPSMSELVVGNNFIDTQQDMLFISNYGITKDSKRYEKNVFLTDGTTSPLKTINGESILGEGDIEVNGGFEVTNVNNDGTVSLALFTNESPSGTVNQLFFSGLYFEPYNGTLTIAASPSAGGGSITIGNHYRPVMPYYGYTNIRIWTGAQSDYDRMDKDDDTLYFITED